MSENKNRKKIILISIIAVILLVAVVAMLIALKPMPVALLSEYGLGLLWEEGLAMNECAECHNNVDFHGCDTCHDDHGAVELTHIPFSEIVEFTGDVPDPTFVKVYQVIPDQENLGTHITLFQFLEQFGVTEFESVTFTTNDGGLTTILFEYLDETAMLVPYVDGVRFVTESVHSSTWLKGIVRITIVGKDKPLVIDGVETSIGRLMLGETIRLTVEGTDVMLSDESGETTHALVANWVDGARLLPLLSTTTPEKIIVTDVNGERTELSAEDIEGSVLAIVRDKVTLVLPDRGRSAWPTEIVEIESN